MKKTIRFLLTSAASFSAFLCLNEAIGAPLSLSFLVALLYAGVSPLPLALAFVSASLASEYLVAIISATVQATFIGTIFLLYSKKNRKPSAEIIIYLFVSSLVYLIFDERAEIVQKLLYMAIITLFSGTCTIACKAFKEKGFSIKYSKGESLCIAALLFVAGAGVYGVFGANVYKSLSVFFILCAIALYEDETSAIFTAFLASVYILTEGEVKYLLPYACYYLAAYSTMEKGKPVSVIFTVSVETIFAFTFNYYGVYGYIEALFFAVPCVVFALIPQKYFDDKRQYLSPGNALSKAALADMRALLSKRIAETANSFADMRSALSSLAVRSPSDKALSEKIANGVKKSCENCRNFQKCSSQNAPPLHILNKIAQIGVAKKRITIIDLPKELLDFCTYPNNVIFEVNRLIEAFSEINEKTEKTDALKNVLSLLARGLERSFLDSSLNLSSIRNTDLKDEKDILKDFAKAGVKIKGLSVAERNEKAEITLLYDKKKFNEAAAEKILSDKFGAEFINSYRTDLNSNTTAAVFRKKPEFSLCYGVSSVTKFSSQKSGDMHSIEQLGNDKVLVALSDGMGSGERANGTSDAAITLIEAFYKIGFDSKSLLPLVNKILSSVTEDDFSAVDICVLDSESGHCDFIKIGAPYGFILSKEGVRFLEGSSLPLGILDVLTPTVAQTTLKKGDILILLSDGVTDAFGSSGDVIEYLKTAPVYNPQELSDGVVKKALELSNGIAEDDMTAFCVRIC